MVFLVSVHRTLGTILVFLFFLASVVGGVSAVLRRVIAGPFWVLLGLGQVGLLAQAAIGIVLLILGARPVPLHFFYGGVFPVAVLVWTHLDARRRGHATFFPLATLVVAALLARAWQTGAFGH